MAGSITILRRWTALRSHSLCCGVAFVWWLECTVDLVGSASVWLAREMHGGKVVRTSSGASHVIAPRGGPCPGLRNHHEKTRAPG